MSNIRYCVVCVIALTLTMEPVFAAAFTDTNVPLDARKTVLVLDGAAASTTPENNSQPLSMNELPELDYVPGEVLVKYKKTKINLDTSSGLTKSISFAAAQSLEVKDAVALDNITVLSIQDDMTVDEKIADLENDANVEFAEPNFKRYSTLINSNDTHKALLWGLDNTGQKIKVTTGSTDADIDAPEAWAISGGATATSPVIVAVIDTGVGYNHPDLLSNMWNGANCKNENGAVLGNCNYGYDFADNDKNPLPADTAHGTHIAGTIAGSKDNSMGIIGVAPNAQIMAIRFDLTIFTEIKAIDFAIQNGAKIINASYSGSGFSQAEYSAISRFKDAGGIFVAAAGNESANNESNHRYPSDYDLDNIISVAATTQTDALASFSNYGLTSVDVGAPGVNIYSTVPSTMSILSETFEGVMPPSVPSGWVKGGTDNNWGTYRLGGSFWGTVLYVDLATPYASNANTTLTSPTYALSSGATLDFWTKCETQYDTNTWIDYLQLEYSADGATFVPATYRGDIFRWDEAAIDAYNGVGPDSTSGAVYHFEGISIPEQYLTNNFKLRLRWVSDAVDNNYDGCLVNNLKITSYSDGADEQYEFMSGTSMAAPHVAGLAALIAGYNPALTSQEIKNIILTSGDTLPALTGKTVSGKRINAEKALLAAAPTVDSTPPVVTLNGSSTQVVIRGTSYPELGATATDDRDGVLPVVITGMLDTNVIGTYVLTYTATDAASNTASTTRTVQVAPLPPDTTPPIITLIGSNQVSITVGSTYVEQGVTAIDAVDGDLTSKVVISGTVTSNLAGIYPLLYSISDTAGNQAQATRTVTVVAQASSGGGGGGSSSGGGSKNNQKITTPITQQVLGAATSTPTTTILSLKTEEELKLALQKQLISLLMQLIVLLQQKMSF